MGARLEGMAGQHEVFMLKRTNDEGRIGSVLRAELTQRERRETQTPRERDVLPCSGAVEPVADGRGRYVPREPGFEARLATLVAKVPVKEKSGKPPGE